MLYHRCHTYRPCREGIILFTDGEANRGLQDPVELVQKYRSEQTKTKCVPVSAITVGGYQARLLIEVSLSLGIFFTRANRYI